MSKYYVASLVQETDFINLTQVPSGIGIVVICRGAVKKLALWEA